MTRIIRVFPRFTKATPIDELVAVNRRPGLLDEADEVHISCTFTWDIPEAEKLVRWWRHVGTVKLGGPAYGDPVGDFVPGMYMRKGNVITSRGCPNKCEDCYVAQREGTNIVELPITEGHIVHDNNLLACSNAHIQGVFDMLGEQPYHCEFAGEWDASRLKEWHVDLLTTIRIRQIWFSYDGEHQLAALATAGKMLQEAGINRTSSGRPIYNARCYVPVGFPGDTMDEADKRLKTVWAQGFMPEALLHRDEQGHMDYEWIKFQKLWACPIIIISMCRKGTKARV